jgi:hypothetical protein
MRIAGRLSLLAAVSYSLAGCASIVKGGAQDLEIRSNPPLARFEVRDNRGEASALTGTTPGKVTLKKGAGYFKGGDYSIVVSKPGYESVTVPLTSTLSGWYLGGNLIFGGLLGYLVVDPVSGAMWTLNPDAVDVTLGPIGSGSPLPASEPVGAHSAAPVLISPLPASAVPLASESVPTDLADGQRMRLLADVPLRPTPKQDSAVRQTLPAGTVIAVRNRMSNAEGNWWFVQTDAGVGWIPATMP